jgi:hypothetical protein
LSNIDNDFSRCFKPSFRAKEALLRSFLDTAADAAAFAAAASFRNVDLRVNSLPIFERDGGLKAALFSNNRAFSIDAGETFSPLLFIIYFSKYNIQ